MGINLIKCSANFIIKNLSKVESKKTFKRTCKDCGAVWNFNPNDVHMENVKTLKLMGKTLLGLSGNKLAMMTPNEDITDLNRCNKCGLRKVTLELL